MRSNRARDRPDSDDTNVGEYRKVNRYNTNSRLAAVLFSFAAVLAVLILFHVLDLV